jgi:hypothetical protein
MRRRTCGTGLCGAGAPARVVPAGCPILEPALSRGRIFNPSGMPETEPWQTGKR